MFLFLLCLIPINAITFPTTAVIINDQLTLANGFLSIDISLNSPSITSIKGNLMGTNQFDNSINTLSQPLRLKRDNCYDQTPTKYTIITNTTESVVISINDVSDCNTTPILSESWHLSISKNDRSLSLVVKGNTISSSASSSSSIHSIHRSIPFNAPSIYSFFDNGVVQMMNQNINKSQFYATNYLQRIYGLGSGASLDISILRPSPPSSPSPSPSPSFNLSTVLFSGSKTSEYKHVILGTMKIQDQWSAGVWNNIGTWKKNEMYTARYQITPNNYNFPAGGLTTGSNLPEKDLIAMMIGIYASAPGNLCTYDNEVTVGKRVAQIATTIASPGRGYGGTYNYFDPDNFIALSSMLYSGNTYLQQQAKAVIERSGSFLNQTTGQLPHHFVNDKPTYLALSGATQTGPNIFWTKTALRYAANSGDIKWLQNYMPTLRNASNFCFNLINDQIHLLNAPGSLMIDVFIRGNYTSDSNAMMVGFLNDFADAEENVGNMNIAQNLRKKSILIKESMNKYLWDQQSNDHYVTQLDLDLITTRDFIDYDSNLIAMAHSIPTPEQGTAILKRIDQGSCSANNGGGPQWVSEIYYGPKDTTGGNIGDSRCSMGRIAWFDAHARKIDGTNISLMQFNQNLVLLQNDLIENTWMHERYGCDGKQQMNRTMYYFEYPSTVVMLLREIKYGINITFSTIEIDPFGPTTYTYDIGNVYVSYDSKKSVKINVPGNRMVDYRITNMGSKVEYEIMVTDCKQEEKMGLMSDATATTDARGVLLFQAKTGCLVSAKALQ